MYTSRRSFLIIGLTALLLLALVLFFITQAVRASRGSLEITLLIAEGENTPSHYEISLAEIDLWSQAGGWDRFDRSEYRFNKPGPGNGTAETTLLERVAEGTYSRLRFSLVAALFPQSDDELLPANILHPTIVLPATITVSREQTTSLTIALQLPESLYQVDDNQYAFVPSVHLTATEPYNASGDLSATSSSQIRLNQTYGMDQNGLMRLNYRLPQSTELTLTDGVLTLPNEQITPEELLRQRAGTSTSTTSDPVDIVDDLTVAEMATTSTSSDYEEN